MGPAAGWRGDQTGAAGGAGLDAATSVEPHQKGQPVGQAAHGTWWLAGTGRVAADGQCQNRPSQTPPAPHRRTEWYRFVVSGAGCRPWENSYGVR